MPRRAIRGCLLAMLIACLAESAACAQDPTVVRGQTVELDPSSPEGAAGKSVGGNIPGPMPDEDKAPLAPWYTVHVQATAIGTGLPPFHSPYVGPNSLVTGPQLASTLSSTLYFAAKMPWEGGMIIINPEIYGGLGVGNVFGLGSPPNGETQRVGDPAPTPYFARFMYQQVIALGGEWEYDADIVNQIPQPRYKNNLVFKIGKMSVTDDFDDNKYAHDTRTQFMNWGLQYNPTFDYGANVRGYTYGAMTELNLWDYSVRYGIFLVSTVANGPGYDMNWGQAHAQAWEFERRWTILNDLPGTVRILGWLNNAHMGNYSEAVQQNPTAPNVVATEVYRSKYGFGISWDQELIKGELGIFGRLGYCQSYAETWMFTEADRTVSIGMQLTGKEWDRPRDEVGVAFMVNGLGPQHRDYLAAGGLGFELGDGKLNYAPESVFEAYYNLRIRKGINLTFDWQTIANPGYNRDRGPVWDILSLRLHYEF